jgi:hypothetical protein
MICHQVVAKHLESFLGAVAEAAAGAVVAIPGRGRPRLAAIS